MSWTPTTTGYPFLSYPGAAYSRRVLVRTRDERPELRYWRPGAEAWEDEAGNKEPAGRWTHWLEIPQLTP